MKCKEIHKLLHKFIDNELDVEQNIKVQKHLDTCANCHSLFIKVQSSFGLLKPNSEISEQAFYFTRLKQKMENKITPKESIFAGFLSKKLVQPVIYLSSLILAVYIGILIGSGSVEQNSYTEVHNNDENYYIESFAQHQYLNELDIEPIENLLLSDNNLNED
jgi:anti-sigma factor RsiW